MARFEEFFDGKEEATLAAAQAILAGVVRLVGDLYSPDRSEAESYLVGIKAILELMAEHPAFAHVSYVAARQTTTATLRDVYDSGTGLLTAMLERLRDYGAADLQPPATGRAALGGAEAVIRRDVVLGRADRLPSLLPDFIYAATVPFLGQAEALRLARQARALL